MSIARRAFTACALGLAVLCAPAAGVLASTSAHAAVTHIRTDGATHSTIGKKSHFVPNGVPEGCASGNFCLYTEGNGGNLCVSTTGNEPTMGGCADRDQTVFNNGSAGVYNSVVSMNFYTNYTGAWTCIGAGHYWLYTSEYYFNNGTSANGLGKPVADNIESFHWQHNNCGSNGP